MSDAWATRIGGALLAVVFVLEVAAVALSAGVEPLTEPVLYLVYAVAQAAAGALIIQRYSRHLIGWVLLLFALLNAVVADFALAYGRRAAETGWPLGPFAELLGMLSWIVAAGGLILLLVLFPDGRLPSPRWRWIFVAWAVGAVLALPAWATNPRLGSEFAAGTNPFAVDGLPSDLVFAAGTILICTALVASIVALVLRLRRATGVERDQLKWVAAAAAVVGIVLPLSGALWTVWEPIQVLSAIALTLLPIAAGVAILRHRLYDVDLLITRAAAYAAIAVVLAGAYVGLVVVTAGFVASPVAAAIAALVIALTFRPVHDRLQGVADRVFLPDRSRARASIAAFVESLRQGEAMGTELPDAFRLALRDDRLTLLFRLPDGKTVDPTGSPTAEPVPGDDRAALVAPTRSGASVVVVHRSEDARLAAAVLDSGGLAVEITALQMQLRRQLRELQESRLRIQSAADDERRRLARDLHDGAQQRLVAIGLTLRHSQHRLAAGDRDLDESLDAAVTELGTSIEELRELAGGLRPRSLDEGLECALQDLAARTPIRLDVTSVPRRFPQHVETAAYFFACEGVTNAVKHAAASRIAVDVAQDNGSLVVTVADDGRGGADPSRGTGLLGLADRIRAHHGELTVTSSAGAGTRLEARLPCE